MKKIFLPVIFCFLAIFNETKPGLFSSITSTFNSVASSTSKYTSEFFNIFNHTINNLASSASYFTAFAQVISLLYNNYVKSNPGATTPPVSAQPLPAISAQPLKIQHQQTTTAISYFINIGSIILPIINGTYLLLGKKSQVLSSISFVFGIINIIKHILSNDKFNKYVNGLTGLMFLFSHNLLKK